jgi:transcriptional regulator with XRE-family HTH domain/quercetin dioxygenase-like cupin family protein
MPVHSSHLVPYSNLDLGHRIRGVRQRAGLTLHALAARSGCSAARLSQIENGEHVPDLRLLLAISDALEEPLATLLPAEGTVPYQVSRDEQLHARAPLIPPDEPRGSADARRLWPLADLFVGRQMEAWVSELPPTPQATLVVAGRHDREFIFVLKGIVEFVILTPGGRIQEQLSPGDCVCFRANLPHSLRGLASTPAETLHTCSCASAAPAGPIAWRTWDGPDPQHEVASREAGDRVRRIRSAQGLPRSVLAARAGLSERQLRQLEEGKRTIRLDEAHELARALGRPVREFMPGGPEPAPWCFVQRRELVGQIAVRQRRHRLELSAMHPTFDYLPLAGGFPNRFMFPYLLRVPNTGIERLVTHEHHGQELIYVLDGQIELTTSAEGTRVKEFLRPGDACYLDATVPHLVRGQSRNPYSDTSASILVVFWCPLGEEYLFEPLPAADDEGLRTATAPAATDRRRALVPAAAAAGQEGGSSSKR